MTIHLTIAPEEADFVAQIEATLSERAKFKQSISRLLNRWEHFVQRVEKHYDFGGYDYTNDLSVRMILDRVMAEAPASLRAKIEQVLAPLDARFMAATQEIAEPLWAGEPGAYWRRIPKKRCQELEDDLRSWGALA